MLSLLSIFSAATLPFHATAAGFQIPGTTIAGMATTDALVANPYEAGALAYNPAAMSFHEQSSITFGLVLVQPKTSVIPEGGSGRVYDDPDAPFKVPNLYLMQALDSDWKLGLNINAPFGLETGWQAGTYPAFSGPLAPLEPTTTRLEMVNINPNLSYRLNSRLSLAVGYDLYMVNEAVFDTRAINIQHDGSGTGWNIAALYRDGPWSFGGSYRSSVRANLNGRFDAESVLGFAVNTRTQLDFPDMLQLGVRFQASERLAFEFDIERTYWSRFKNLSVYSKESLPAAGIEPGSLLVNSENNWDDIYACHFGALFDIDADLQLRLGYTYNENPQSESYFSNRYPNARRHVLGAGAKYSMERWDLEAGLLYARWKDRVIDNSAVYTGDDPNGTAAINGKYEIRGLFMGVGASRYF